MYKVALEIEKDYMVFADRIGINRCYINSINPDGTIIYNNRKVINIQRVNGQWEIVPGTTPVFRDSDCCALPSNFYTEMLTGKSVNLHTKSDLEKLKSKLIILGISYESVDRCIIVKNGDKVDIYTPCNDYTLKKELFGSQQPYITLTPKNGDLRVNGIDLAKVSTFDRVFSEKNLRFIDISTLATDGAVWLSRAFGKSVALVLDFSKHNFRNALYMDRMFFETQASCVNMSNNTTEKLVSTEYMFCGAEIDKLDIKNLNTSRVVNMLGMFQGFTGEIVGIENLDTRKVDNMSYMFCEVNTGRLDLRNFNLNNVKLASNMFQEAHINVLDVRGLNFKDVKIAYNLFSNAVINEIWVNGDQKGAYSLITDKNTNLVIK